MAQGVGQPAAGVAAIGEAPAEVGEDGRIGAVEREQLAVEQFRRGAGGAAEARVGDDRHVRLLRDQLCHERQPQQHGRDHDGADAFILREFKLLQNGAGCADQVGHVNRAAARGAVGFGDGLLAGSDAVGERMEALVGEAVVVLDDVDSCMREEAAEKGEPLRGQADRFERRAGHRTVGYADDLAQTGRAEARSGQRAGSAGPLGGQGEVDEFDVRLERRVAEQDVEELRRIVRRGADREVDDHGMKHPGNFVDRDKAADDVPEHEWIAQCGAGQLHRLFQQQRLDAGFEFGAVRRGDVVSGAQRRPGGGGRGHGTPRLVDPAAQVQRECLWRAPGENRSLHASRGFELRHGEERFEREACFAEFVRGARLTAVDHA